MIRAAVVNLGVENVDIVVAFASKHRCIGTYGVHCASCAANTSVLACQGVDLWDFGATGQSLGKEDTTVGGLAREGNHTLWAIYHILCLCVCVW